MRLGIRGKLFAVSFGLIILSLLAGEIYLRPSIEANLLDEHPLKTMYWKKR